MKRKTSLGVARTGKGPGFFVQICAMLAVLCLMDFFTAIVDAQILGTSQLNVERRGHTATLLSDSKVLIAGGDNQNGVIAQSEIFDPAVQSSTLGATLTAARTDHTATLLYDGRVLVIGGRNQNGSLSSTEIYDPMTGTFSAGPSLTTPRAGHTATVLANDNILVAGGDGLGSAEIYNPTTQSFSLIAANMTAVRKFHSAILTTSGQVLIVGGVNTQNSMLKTAEVFDPSSQSFYLPPTDMQTPRALATLKLLADGKVQIIGGDADLSMEIFDATSGIFIAKALLPPNADLLGATLSTQSRAALFSPLVSQDPLLQGVLTLEQLILLDRADQSITELPSRNQALVAGGINSAGQILNSAKLVSSSMASVTTDKTDYAPGQIVTITGSGFQPNEQVDIYFHEFPEEYADIFLSAVANQQGNFVVAEFAPQDIDFGRIFTLTALGQSSGFAAQTAFKDAGSITSISPISGPTTGGTIVTITGSSSPFAPGQAPFTVKFDATNVTGTRVDNNNLTATTPAHVSGAVNVTVTDKNGIISGVLTFTYTVAGTAPTITSANNTTFTVATAGSFAVTTAGTPTPALSRTGALPNGVTFTDNGNGTATLSGTPALGTVGTYNITITANNGVSPNATQDFTLTVQKANQAVLTLLTTTPLTYNHSEILSVTGGTTNGMVTYNLVSGPCAISGNQLTANSGTGSCSLTATMAGNDNYNDVTSTPANVVNLQKANQAALTLLTTTPLTYNHSEILSVTGGTTNGMVTYNLVSGPCAISGNQLTANSGTGSCSLTATMAGNDNYNDVTSTPANVVNLQKANQLIYVTMAAPGDAFYNSTFNVTATGGGSGNAVLITTAGVCSVNSGGSNSATILMTSGTGNCIVKYNQAGNDNYNAATEVMSITAAKKVDPTCTVYGYTGMYDTAAHGATGSCTGVGGPSDVLAGLSLGDSFTYVPGGTANWTFTDATGNYNNKSGSVAIVINTAFAFNGFYSPIGGSVENYTGGSFANPLRAFKLGSTIPVKFGATWLNGGAPLIIGIHTLQAVKYSSATSIDGDPIDATPTDAATTGNQFRLTGTEWHFNLSTKGLTAGTWLLKATLVDGSQYTVWISLKK